MPSSARGPARAGFTLVELLVVIGIIALLVAILLPTLSQARQQAATVKCASNMRQIAMGWMLYADAHQGTMVPARLPNLGSAAKNVTWIGNGEFWRPRWFALLGAQTGLYAHRAPSPLQADENTQLIDNAVFLCPAEPERISGRHYTFGYNHQFLGNARNKDGTPSGTTNPIHYPVKSSRIAAAMTVMFTDSMGTAAGKPASQRRPYRNEASIDNFAHGNHGFTLDPPRLTPDSDRCDDNNRGDEHRSAPDPRHRGRTNVAFCDGRVESMTLRALGYVQNPDGSIAATGPGAHNRLFSGNGQDLDPPPVK
jgi:prepilin-type N-terminal cleavage/methylation domain-containing protein/prepilin-type processing-associated H-X9-DG protein